MSKRTTCLSNLEIIGWGKFRTILLSEEFFESDYFQIGQHVVLLHILIGRLSYANSISWRVKTIVYYSYFGYREKSYQNTRIKTRDTTSALQSAVALHPDTPLFVVHKINRTILGRLEMLNISFVFGKFGISLVRCALTQSWCIDLNT